MTLRFRDEAVTEGGRLHGSQHLPALRETTGDAEIVVQRVEVDMEPGRSGHGPSVHLCLFNLKTTRGLSCERGRLCGMSNNQWNSGQGSNEWAPQQGGSNEWGAQQGGQQEWNQQGSNQEWGQAQPQSSAQEWGQAQPQASAQDWNQQQGQAASGNDWGQGQQSAQDWNQQQGQAAAGNDWGQAQPQASAQDWNQAQPQASAQDWNQQQGQAAAGNDWGQGQQSAQDWNQQGGQGGQQDWNQQQGQNWNQQQGGQYFPAQQGQFQGQPAERKASPFDFSFKQLSLPSAAGMIFMIGVIAVGVEWLFGFLQILVDGNSFGFEGGDASVMGIIGTLIGGLAAALFKVLVLRVLIEIGVAGAKLLKKAEEPKDEA